MPFGNEESVLGEVVDFDETLKGQYCVVTYDGQPYPGIIHDVDDEEIEVMVMHKVGENRYFWPLRDDSLWYQKENFVCLIPPPCPVTKRHHQIDKCVWEAIKKKLSL